MLELFKTSLNNSSLTAKEKAQNALHGRTHYAENAELKFFDAKILACSISECGRFCFIVESLPLPLYIYGMSRKKRGKVFNILGEVLFTTAAYSMDTRNTSILSAMAGEVQKDETAYWHAIKDSLKSRYSFNMRFINQELERV